MDLPARTIDDDPRTLEPPDQRFGIRQRLRRGARVVDEISAHFVQSLRHVSYRAVVSPTQSCDIGAGAIQCVLNNPPTIAPTNEPPAATAGATHHRQSRDDSTARWCRFIAVSMSVFICASGTGARDIYLRFSSTGNTSYSSSVTYRCKRLWYLRF